MLGVRRGDITGWVDFNEPGGKYTAKKCVPTLEEFFPLFKMRNHVKVALEAKTCLEDCKTNFK